jgi:hypothetical protein
MIWPNIGLVEKFWNSVKQQYLDDVFILFHYIEKQWLQTFKLLVEKYFIFIGVFSNKSKCYIDTLERVLYK